jgi:heme exporter protein D
MNEYIMTISIAVQAIATIALVWATVLLVKHTRLLANVTKELARIEHSRDDKAQGEKTLNNLEQIYELSENILKIDPGLFGAGLYPIAVSAREEIALLKQLELLKIQIGDIETLKILNELLGIIKTLEQGTKLEETIRVDTINKFVQFQKRLTVLRDKWRTQLTLNKA